ncbi:hypothetical protein [uncultured Maribacter sp.]|uniref:hypothetical protein n=1 Tax=uncultured Maribacter sp. TaxID=431308 RepID=UPI00262D5E74|nr:hypothetical protein [uncultured Maribacter sp.]
METVELKKIWSILAEEKLIDKNLAKEHILEIITKKGNGIISKLERKHKHDFNVYMSIAIFMLFVILFLIYRDSLGLLSKTNSRLGGAYLIPCLMEAFIIYVLISLKRNLNFTKYSYNTGTLKESLINVKTYFKTITKKGNWIGTISLIAIFVLIEIDTLMKIGGISNMNFSSNGSYIFESYFALFLMIMIFAMPFIVKMNAKQYTSILQDLDRTIEELNEEPT